MLLSQPYVAACASKLLLAYATHAMNMCISFSCDINLADRHSMLTQRSCWTRWHDGLIYYQTTS